MYLAGKSTASSKREREILYPQNKGMDYNFCEDSDILCFNRH